MQPTFFIDVVQQISRMYSSSKTETLDSLNNNSLFPPCPFALSNHYYIILIYEFGYFKYLI